MLASVCDAMSAPHLSVDGAQDPASACLPAVTVLSRNLSRNEDAPGRAWGADVAAGTYFTDATSAGMAFSTSASVVPSVTSLCSDQRSVCSAVFPTASVVSGPRVSTSMNISEV